MKKTFSILLAVIMMFSVVSCLSVGALSGSTTDEATDVDVNTGITPDVDLQVKKDAYENFYDEKIPLDEIIITYAGVLSDGSLLLNVTWLYAAHLDAIYTDTIGDYYYIYCPSDLAYVYREHNFYDIFNAYDDGLIDDSTLAEFCEISKEYNKHYYNDWTFSFYPTKGESGLDYLVESDIKFDAYKNLFGYEYVLGEPLDLSNIMITYFGQLSDGSLVLNAEDAEAGVLDVVITETIGNYRYVMYDSGQKAYIYKNHQFYYIVDAYNSGMIDDDVLDELYACSVEYLKNPKNNISFVLYPLSQVTTTQPQTTNVEDTKATNSANLTSSTSDTAETKTTATSDTVTTKNSNGVVQTGQSNLVILLTLLLVISVAMVAVFMKSRYRD